jgi:hypothetical protein
MTPLLILLAAALAVLGFLIVDSRRREEEAGHRLAEQLAGLRRKVDDLTSWTDRAGRSITSASREAVHSADAPRATDADENEFTA